MGHGGTWVRFVKCGKHCRQALSSLPTILSSSVKSFNDTKIFTGIISFELPLKSQSKLNLNLVNSASTSRCCIYQPALASTPKHHRLKWEMTMIQMGDDDENYDDDDPDGRWRWKLWCLIYDPPAGDEPNPLNQPPSWLGNICIISV